MNIINEDLLLLNEGLLDIRKVFNKPTPKNFRMQKGISLNFFNSSPDIIYMYDVLIGLKVTGAIDRDSLGTYIYQLGDKMGLKGGFSMDDVVKVDPSKTSGHSNIIVAWMTGYDRKNETQKDTANKTITLIRNNTIKEIVNKYPNGVIDLGFPIIANWKEIFLIRKFSYIKKEIKLVAKYFLDEPDKVFQRFLETE